MNGLCPVSVGTIFLNVYAANDVEKVPQIIVGSQHFSMTFGHWLPAMTKAGDLLGFKVQHL